MDAPLQQYNIQVPNYTLPKNIINSETGKIQELRRFIIGEKFISQIKETITKVAESDASVLIQGETGTGKELVASAIHYNSLRKDKPLLKVSCATLLETLLESELFGHERGSYTGAITRRLGRFELADGGTIFLDEIAEINHFTQTKLLRVLQEKKFERVGGTDTINVDVRIIAATHKNLEEEIRQGRFREDLYYRLNVVPIFIPPLRERKEDIPYLVMHFLSKYAQKYNKTVNSIEQQAMDLLMDHDWPGNVRELENVIHRTVIFVESDKITFDLLNKINMMDISYSTYKTSGHQEHPRKEEVLSYFTTLKHGEKITNKALRKIFGIKNSMSTWRYLKEACSKYILQEVKEGEVRNTYYVKL